MGQKRLLSIDLIKVVAMCAVMCLHTQYAYSVTSPLAHFLYISAVVAIPLFFMTSGWLFSIVLFVALRDMDGKNLAFVNGGGKMFLPCYAIHLFLIGSTQNYFEKIFPDSLGVNAMALCFWLFICIISISLSWLIMKIPFMDKVFRI